MRSIPLFRSCAGLLVLGLGACASAPPALVEVGPQTFEASVGATGSQGPTALWRGLREQAQLHCERRQATAIGLQERRDDALGRLVLVFRCQ